MLKVKLMALWLLYFFPAVKEMYGGVVSWFTFPRRTPCSGHSRGLQSAWMCSGTLDAEPKPQGGLESCVGLLTCLAWAFLLAFLGLISNYVTRDKLDGWCHKMPRAQLLVMLRCSMEKAHQTTVVTSYHPFSLFPKLRASAKHGEGRNDWERGAKSGERRKKNSFRVFILLSSFQHSKSSCVDMFYFHCFAKKSFLQMYSLAPSCPGFLIPVSFAHQALVMGFANSLSMSYQGQCKNNVALLCGISCFSWLQ